MLKLFKAEIILIGCQYLYYSSFLCCYCYSCGVLSAIHLDLGCTHTRGSDPCLSMIDPQSSVHFTSVTALYRVQCGSFNHNPLEEVAQEQYTCSVVTNRTGAWNSSFIIFVCVIVIMTAKIFITTWISHFSINLISSTCTFIMGLVVILLMNMYCSLRVKLQIPPLTSADSVIILWYLSVSERTTTLGF